MSKSVKREANSSIELYMKESDDKPAGRTSKAPKSRRCTDSPEDLPEFSFITCTPSLEAAEDAGSNHDIAHCAHIQLMSARMTSLEGTVIKAINLVERLTQEVRLLKHEIHQLHNPAVKEEPPITESKLTQLPYTDVNDFLEFEEELKDAAQFQVLVSHFTQLANAKSSSEFVRNAWRSVVVDNVAKHFSWKGTAEKVSVKKLLATAALENAFKKKYPTDSIEIFEKKTKMFFLYANDRMVKMQNYHKRKQTEKE